jgi:hypothetical protein
MSYDAGPSIEAVKAALERRGRYLVNAPLIWEINNAIDKVKEAKQPQDLDSAYRIKSKHYAGFVKAMKFKDEGEIASTELAINIVHEKLMTEFTSHIGAHITNIQHLIHLLCEQDASSLERDEHKDVLRDWHRDLHELMQWECHDAVEKINTFDTKVWSWVLNKNVSNAVKDLGHRHEVDRNIAKLREAQKHAMVVKVGVQGLVKAVSHISRTDGYVGGF